MKKKSISPSDIFVKKISEKIGKMYTREELARIWELSGGSRSRLGYALTLAKNEGVLHPIGGGVYIIGSLGNLELHFWKALSLLIERYAPSGGIVAHEKSMEYHLRNFEIPEYIVVYTRDTEKRIMLGRHEIHFRTLKSGEKSGGKNMYRILFENSEDGIIEGASLRILSLEASLLDVASLRIHDSGIAESLILRFLKKYHSQISREKLGTLVRYRYIRAMNRIRSLSKAHGYEDIYSISLDIIKKEGGGCYLHL